MHFVNIKTQGKSDYISRIIFVNKVDQQSRKLFQRSRTILLNEYLIRSGSSSNLTTLFASCSLGPGSNTSCTSAHLSIASNSIVDSTSSIHFHTPAHSSSSFNPSSPLHSSSAFHSSSSFYPSSPLNSSLPTALQPSHISSATRPSVISSRSLLTPSVLIQPHTSSLIPSRPPYLAPSSSVPAQPSSGFSSQGSSPLHASPIQGNYPSNTVITNRN